MTTRFACAPGLAVLLVALPALAVTDTWDGGGGNNLITLGDNWIDNTAPVSDVANTDLIFAGLTRLTPALNASFSTRSITFNNTAGAFIIGGQTFIVGTGGIMNNDTQTMAFENSVRFSGVADSTIVAAAGGLGFTGTVFLPTDTLTVAGGGPSSFTNFTGSSTINKKDAGTMTWTPTLPQSCDVTFDAGTLTMGADGGADNFDAGASIAVNGTGTFNINESLTLDGAQLTRATGGTVNIAAGKTLTVQNGGDAVITGAFTNNLASTIAVSGTGSTFSTTDSLAVRGGSTLNVSADGDVTSGTSMSIGTSGNGTVTVDGAGSTLAGTGLTIGSNTAAGSLAFTNNSGGTFTAMSLVPTATGGAVGLLSIESGADVTGTSLNLAIVSGANTGTVTVTGAGSTLAVSGSGTAIIGAGSGNSGTLNVNTSGSFTSGTGQTTVSPTGTIAIGGGTYTSKGNLTVNGGRLTRSSTGVLTVDPGTTLTAQNGGDITITGGYFNTAGENLVITGAGSTFTTTSGASFRSGATVHISAGGQVSCGSFSLFRVGNLGSATVTVDGIGSTLSSGTLSVAEGGATGSITFTNGGSGAFEEVKMAENHPLTPGVNGTLSILSGSTVTADALTMETMHPTDVALLLISGAGSSLTLSNNPAARIGSAFAGTATLQIENGGVYTDGAFFTEVLAHGAININNNGTFNSNGTLNVDGGQLTRSLSGVLNHGTGDGLFVQNGGDAIFTGSYTPGTNVRLIVRDTGSTLSCTGNLNIEDGSSLTVQNGGTVSVPDTIAMRVGKTSGNGTVTVDGIGSSLSAGQLQIAGAGHTGSVTFRNGSTGNFGFTPVADFGTAGTNGTLNIESGATVNAAGIAVGTNFSGVTGLVTITGAGSALTLGETFTANIGGSSGATGTVNVGSGATFTTGSTVSLGPGGTLNVLAGGTLTGAADFSAITTGTLNLAGAYIPGRPSGPNQTTSASFGVNLNLAFQPTSSVTMEIGGLSAGTQHDQVVFDGSGATHVTWNGALNVVLINGFTPQAGQSFNLFDFDPARDAGAFTSINVVTNGLMPPGLAFNFDDLYTTGVIRVVSTGGITFAQWAATALGDAGAPPLGDHNGNGYTNLIEYALGLFPAVAATVQPDTALHVYPDGERLRVLFTRPLDRTDITIRVQASADLTNWTDLAVSVNSAPFTGAGFVSENRAHPLSDPGLVEVRDVLNTSSAARRYGRIEVTLEP